MLPFYSEEMSSLRVIFPVKGYSSLVQNDATETKSKEKGWAERQGRKLKPNIMKKGITLQLNSLLFKGSTRAKCFVQREN